MKSPLLCLAAACAFAQEGYRLGGNVDLAHMGVETPAGSGNSLSQRYALNLQRAFTPLLSAHGSLRYYHLGQEQGAVRSFQSELQPMAQLGWNAPWFSLGAHAQRGISESSAPGSDMTRENGSVNLKTKSEDYPNLSLRYDASRMFTPESLQIRNLREERLQGGATWAVKSQSLSYQASRQKTENLNRATVHRGTSHSFRWDQGSQHLDRRLRLRSEYALNYREERFDKPDSIPGMQQVAFRRAFFAIDRTPQFSFLDTVDGLADGNRAASPAPSIVVGPENTGVNIALDFGRQTDAGILHLYTARPARSGGAWSVYVSNPPFASENMEWAPLIGGAESRYDETYQRFEISFRNSGARFLKVVFDGTADTGRAEVTEVEAFRQEAGGGANRFYSSSQMASLNTTYLLSERFDVSADLGLRNEPFAPAGVKKKAISTRPCPATRGSIPC